MNATPRPYTLTEPEFEPTAQQLHRDIMGAMEELGEAMDRTHRARANDERMLWLRHVIERAQIELLKRDELRRATHGGPRDE